MSRTPPRTSLAGIGSAPRSGIPGPPRGPAFFSTRTESDVTSNSGSSMRRRRSSMSSNTTASPVCENSSGDVALILITAPLGAKLSRNTAIEPDGCSGSDRGRMTPFSVPRRDETSTSNALPVTVRVPPSSSRASSASTAGIPPSWWRSSTSLASAGAHRDDWSSMYDPVETVKSDVHADSASDCEKMTDGVRRPSERHQQCDHVVKSCLSKNRRRAQPFLCQANCSKGTLLRIGAASRGHCWHSG